MKYILLVFLLFILLELYISTSFLSKVNTNTKTEMIENCTNPCLSCQNTLYFLKFRGNAECQFNRCPGLCMSLSGQWNSNRNDHLNFFRNDQINICEACFRSNHCHINDCILEKTIVHNAIKHATEKFNYHYLNPNSVVFKMINKKADDYFFNMDFIFKNFDKSLELLKHYDSIYSDSIKMKKFYKIILKFLAEKSKINLSDINMGLNIDIDEDILPQWHDIIEHVHIYKDYYIGLKSDKIHLNEEKIYLSTDIKKEEDIITNIIDFDNKVKNGLYKTHNITELYKVKCHQNLEVLRKLVTSVDVIRNKNLGIDKKLEILTGKVNYTPEQLRELFENKISDPIKNLITNEIGKVSPISITVAGKTIKLAKPGLNNTNYVTNVENRIKLMNTPIPMKNNTNSPSKISNEDEVDLFDDETDEENSMEDLFTKSKPGMLQDKIQQQKSNNIIQRIQEPSLGDVLTASTKLQPQNLKQENSLDKNIIRVIEPSLNQNGNPNLNKSTNLNINTIQEVNKNNLNNNHNVQNNLPVNNNNLRVTHENQAIPQHNQGTIPEMPNLMVKSTIPNIPNLTSNIPPLPNPALQAAQALPPNAILVKSTIPLQNQVGIAATSQLLPNAGIPNPGPLIPTPGAPTISKVTLVKLTSPNDSYNKNVFKPDAKIDNIAKAILGIDPRPKVNPPVQSAPQLLVSSVGVQQIRQVLANNSTINEEKLSEIIHIHNKDNEIPQNKLGPFARKSEDEDDMLDDDDDDDMDDEEEKKKTFIQKNTNVKSKESSEDLLDLDLSILKADKNLIKNNRIKKLSVEEIKNSAHKFMDNLKNRVNDHKFKGKSSNFADEPSFLQEDNKTLEKVSRNSNNIVNALSSNLKGLDDEFFEIKHNIIMNLMK